MTINGATDTQSMLNITLGSNVTITCSLQGDPPPVLSWIHNGVTRRDPISLSMSTLVVEDFHSRDAGVYQCQAENVYQISIQSVFLVAIGENLIFYIKVSLSSVIIMVYVKVLIQYLSSLF